MNEVDYSIVVPVFNSEASLEELFARLVSVMEEEGKSFECIFVDDGSRDDSWEVLKKIKSGDPDRVTAVKLAKNFGQHSATFCGFNLAKGDYILTIDDDLQCPPEEIPKLIKSMDDADAELVYGIFKHKKHSMYRNLGSRSVKNISHFLGKPKDGSSFRLITKNIIQKIIIHHQNFVFIDEILHWHTDDISFAVVDHHPRKYKRSGYNAWKMWNMLANIMYYYTTVPLKIMIYAGLTSSVFFFILSVYFILRKILMNVPLGYTSLIVAILFSTSLILLSLGVIGEYLSRIYMVQNKKPLYSVRKVL